MTEKDRFMLKLLVDNLRMHRLKVLELQDNKEQDERIAPYLESMEDTLGQILAILKKNEPLLWNKKR